MSPATALRLALAIAASAAPALATPVVPSAAAEAEVVPARPIEPALDPAVPTAPLPPPLPPPGPGLPSAMAAIVGSADTFEIDGERVDGVLARDLYAPRAFAPQWVEGAGPDRVAAVLDVLRRAEDEGLEPRSYHVDSISRRLAAADERQRAELELLVSDAVMRYAVHVRTGAYRPARPTKTIDRVPPDVDPTRFAIEAAAVPDVRAYLEALPPRTKEYVALKDALAFYRKIAADGGWRAVSEGPKLTPGVVDPAVRVVRQRLVASGEAESVPGKKANVYDPALVRAVKSFQSRHGLGADGVVGARTWAALGVPVEDRVRQLEVALERARWMPEDLGERYVIINVVDQRLQVRDRDHVEVDMPVVVGKPTWSTPEFSADLTELVFNPPWFIPPKIAREEVLPKMRADQSYFARQGIAVRGGVKIASARSPSVADDASPTPADVVVVGPIRLRQAPGPKNPLGRIKFNMPNGFGVYLHDTPNKNPFRGPDRRLSHGCVRVADARKLAGVILRDMPRWDESRQAAVLAGWETRKVSLDRPIPVHLVYRTAWIDDDGRLQLRDDVYDRDADLLARWDKPRSVRRPPPPPPSAPDVAAAPGGSGAAADAPGTDPAIVSPDAEPAPPADAAAP